ncbi:hypothetical protein WN55_04000 [Dufourea novaeangliae]|uniref:Uncharacterized protein n=1 Tax=Dufourea novaeangliae TaxID=178035 RepID=A0A154PKT3_DUFNO|nr:hypothetical protein WN55_04000 [Dufourea novaeangliae]
MKLLFALTLLLTVICASMTMAASDEYIHLPGKSCADAPPCPDNRPCVMAPPRCNVGTCGKNPVPTCGKRT